MCPRDRFITALKARRPLAWPCLAPMATLFAHKLDKFLLDDAVPPLERMAAFVRHAGQGMEKYQFRRGCLVGNLLQEAPLLPDTFPGRLKAILTAWGRAWPAACTRRRLPERSPATPHRTRWPRSSGSAGKAR